MSGPSEIEKTNLEAHVELCHQRYVVLDARLTKIDTKMDSLRSDIVSSNKGLSKVLITAAATVVGGLLSTIVVVLITFL